MKMGTKSLLFGCHQFILHPLFVWAAWVKLYGWRFAFDSKSLVCIVIHDWGYWGSPNMDGKRGERHPAISAAIIRRFNWEFSDWYEDLVLLHSRTVAHKLRRNPSPLCYADKLGTAMMPTWLWVGLGRLTGEIKEYTSCEKYKSVYEGVTGDFEHFKVYKQWVKENLYG